MGNCFALPEKTGSNPFSKPGRRLNDSPDLPAYPRYGAKPPALFHSRAGNIEPVYHGPDQMDTPLGGAHNTESPREAARKAAEARAVKAKAANSGKLQQQLNQQKQQTRSETLEAASKQERQARVADENAEALQHN